MKTDMKILLKYLRDYIDVYYQSEMHLHGENEDEKMRIKIKKIAKKHGLKF